MKGGKMKNQKKLVLILVVLLVLTVGYITFDKYSNYNQEKNIGIYNQGAQYGYEQAIIQVAQQVATCQQIPLKVQNQTINIVAVDCLK
jgi:hypothetical protein